MKISAAADIGTLLSSDMLPVARSGDTNGYHATMTEVAAFTNASVASGAYGNVGRNQLHNSLFNVQQRGSGPWTAANSYTADRWELIINAPDTNSVTVATLADSDRTQIGDEAARYALRDAFVGGTGGGSYITQKIEGVRRLSGKTVTVSFWANTTGSSRIGVNLAQVFGSGGSPSGPVWATAVVVTTTTSWARYSATIALPSATGKTFGTNGDDSTWLALFFSDTTALSGTIGVQSGTVELWGVQLEVGGATPLEKPDPQQDLAKCQRFYWQLSAPLSMAGNAPAAGYNVFQQIFFPSTMRAPPAVAGIVFAGGGTNVSTDGFQYVSASRAELYITAAAAGGMTATLTAVSFSADL